MRFRLLLAIGVLLLSSNAGSVDGCSILIEVRYRSGTSCSPWTLTINGNTPTATPVLACP